MAGRFFRWLRGAAPRSVCNGTWIVKKDDSWCFTYANGRRCPALASYPRGDRIVLAGGLMLRLHWHIFYCAFPATQKMCQCKCILLTHFSRGDVCDGKLTRQLFHSQNACKRATHKMCGAFTHAQMKRDGSTQKMCGKNVPV